MFDDIGVGITFILNNYDEVDNKIRTLQKRLHLLSKVKLGDTFSETNKQAASLMGKLEQLESSINGMANGAATLNSNLNGIKNVETSTSKMSKNAKSFSEYLHTMVSGAKKLAFSLLTVRGVWFAIRKSMTTYLSQNDELKSKLDGLYYGVGSMFAPLLEVLVNGLINIISYIDVVVKSLGFAGINMKNYGKATSSAAKETQKLLKIDEINNLNESSSGSGSSYDVSKMFEDVVLNDKLRNFATNLGLTIKDVFFEWGDISSEAVIQKAIVGITSLLGYMIGGLPGMLIGLGIGLVVDTLIFDHDGLVSSVERLKATLFLALAGALGGFILGGVSGALIGLTIGVVISLALTAGDVVETKVNEGDIKTALSTAVAQKDTTISLDRMEFLIQYPQLADTSEIKEMFRLLGGECSEEQANGYLESLNSGTLDSTQFFESIRENVLQASKEVGSEAGQEFVNGEAEAIASDTETIPTAIQTATTNLQDTYEQLKKDSSLAGTSMITAMTSGVVDNKGKILKAWEDIKVTILGNWQELESGIKNSCNNIVSTIEGMLNSIISGFNSFSNNINNLSYEQKDLMGIGFALASIESVSLPRLATGTNYVPNDMVAMIHQGEAVVPKEFNPSTFYGTNTAEELNLLASINEQLVELNRKDYNIELDGESVVKKIDNRINELNFRNGNKVFAIQR